MAERDDHPEWTDEERVMISALEHYSYCPRQCALIHVEQTFDENLYTLRGRRVHERVDTAAREQRPGRRIERALPLWSDRLGLVGRADVVEFHGATPYPVEYKQGKKRRRAHAEVQLCAQALCLEEMTGKAVPEGALFHAASHRREAVTMTDALRRRVEELTAAVRVMLRELRVPPPINDARCRRCSLKQACMPASIDDARHQQQHARALFQIDDA